jgi:hypothetical protein
VGATAEIVTGARYDDIRDRITAEYGFMTKVTKLLGAVGGTPKRNRIPYDVGVVLTVS